MRTKNERKQKRYAARLKYLAAYLSSYDNVFSLRSASVPVDIQGIPAQGAKADVSASRNPLQSRSESLPCSSIALLMQI